MKKLTAMILSAMIAVSFTGADAFAFAGTNTAGQLKAATNTKSTTAKPAPTTKAKKPAPPKLAAPKKLRAYSSYNSVKLQWAAVPKAEEYFILRSVAGKNKFKQIGRTKKTEYVDKVKDIYTDYAYRVIAGKKHDKKFVLSKPAKIRENSIRRLRIYVTFKTNEKYSTGTIHKGTRLMTDGYGGGYYVFPHKGKRHSVSRIAVKDAAAKYEKKENYKKSEAAFFITDYLKAKKIRTDKKYVIWVSTYTQHLYVFKKKKGKWKVVRDWEVSTGRASAPTSPGKKIIVKKRLFHHDIQFWSCFASGNALHGVSGNMYASLGRTASHGCVRNSTADAAWIYANCAKGTTVIIY